MSAKKATKLVEKADATDREIRKAIGKKISEIRKKRHLSAESVAKELRVSREAVTHIETGRNNITALSLWKLAVLFGCDIQDFFPVVPDGFQITKADLDKLAQEDERAAEWAKKLFTK